ncbi:MAG: hypothetical protein ABIO44_11910 [Saprospiraceae bacterium]
MKTKKQLSLFLILTGIVVNLYAQDGIPKKYSKHFSAGITAVISMPFFPNALPSLDFRMERNGSKWSGKINMDVLVRARLEYFIAVVTNLDVERSFLLKNNRKMFIGCGPGLGVNTFPSVFPMFNFSFSYPVWKLYFGVQPTLVITNIYSSYLGISCKYSFGRNI